MPYLALLVITTAPTSFSTSKLWPHTSDLIPLFSSLQLSPYLKLNFSCVDHVMLGVMENSKNANRGPLILELWTKGKNTQNVKFDIAIDISLIDHHIEDLIINAMVLGRKEP